MSELRIDLVGTGGIGRTHIERINTKLQGAKVVACADPAAAFGLLVAEKFGIKGYEDPIAMINDPEIDAIINTTADAYHEQFVTAAIKAGKYVFCEKPLAPKADACKRIIAAEMEAGKPLVQVGFMRRYDAGYKQLKEAIETRKYGEPLLGFFAAVMFGAILSSFNSVLNSASTIYALDVHRPLFNPEASDSYMVKIGQRFGTVVAVFATILSPFMLYMGGITTFVNSCFAAFNTPIFVCLIVGFLSKKAPTIMPKIVIPVHVVLYCTLQFGLRNVIPALENVHYLYFTATLFVLDMIMVVIITKMCPREKDFVLEDVGAVELAQWKHGKIVAAVVLCVMVAAYIVFSPLGLGA